jgi:branched-chain amino acid transport system permease protein
MVAVGGIGNFWGAVLGAMLLTFLPEYLRAYEGLEVLLYGLILAAVMMFLPGGLVSILRSLSSYARNLVRGR